MIDVVGVVIVGHPFFGFRTNSGRGHDKDSGVGRKVQEAVSDLLQIVLKLVHMGPVTRDSVVGSSHDDDDVGFETESLFVFACLDQGR